MFRMYEYGIVRERDEIKRSAMNNDGQYMYI